MGRSRRMRSTEARRCPVTSRSSKVARVMRQRAIGSALLWFSIALPDAYGAEALRAAVAFTGKRSDERKAQALMQEIRRALDERRDLQLLPRESENRLFQGAAPEVGRSRASLNLARRHLKQAAKSFALFDLQDAVRSVTKARESLEDWIGLRPALELDRDRLQLAIAIAHAERNEVRLSQWLAEYTIRFPNEPPPPGLWPPDLIARVRSAKSAAESVLTVRSQPPGRVFIDGREVGPSPVWLGGIPAGRHRIEVEAPDHRTVDAWVETTKDKEAVIDLVLVPDISSKLEQIALTDVIDPGLLKSIRDMVSSNGVDLLFLVDLDRDDRLIIARVAIEREPGASHDTPPLSVARAESTPGGVRSALAQLLEAPLAELPVGTPLALADLSSPPRIAPGVPLWAWIGGTLGALATSVGVGVRLEAVATRRELDAKQGALTQREAFSLRDRGESEARVGALLIGAGIVAIAGIAGLVAFDVVPSDGGE